MASRQTKHLRSLGSLPGLLLAVLALVSQLALGSIAMPDEAAAREQSVAALDSLSIICSATTPVEHAPGQHHHHGMDCAVCPLCAALAMHAVVLGSGPDLPAPSSRLAHRATLPPPARAPPAQPRHAPPPRGPPVLT